MCLRTNPASSIPRFCTSTCTFSQSESSRSQISEPACLSTMALVGYGSSDDEEDETLEIEQQRLPDRPIDRTEADKVPDDNNNSTISHIQAREGSSSQNEQPSPSSPSQQHQAPGQNASVRAQASTASNPEAEAAAPPIGPQLGPSATPEAQVLPGHLAGPSFPPLEGAEDSGGGTGSQSSSSLSQPQPQPQKPQPAPAGSSPFTTHRTTLRDLTLPTVPNMDIPFAPARADRPPGGAPEDDGKV
ncbi:hypothetical protein MN608_04577 [Microdochium nivale]|nr:hypothetical protein MN608_04577 [Microdochium nivale]